MKYSLKHQNVYTTSHRKTRKLTPSTLRATSRATKTPTRLYKILQIRTCLAAEAIDYMVSEGILEPQIKPTPQVSSVTYPVKPSGEVRPCLDARDLNRGIIHENHKPQMVEEIAHQLAGAVVFMKADTLKAFLQVHLTEESSKLLVINTHKG